MWYANAEECAAAAAGYVAYDDGNRFGHGPQKLLGRRQHGPRRRFLDHLRPGAVMSKDTLDTAVVDHARLDWLQDDARFLQFLAADIKRRTPHERATVNRLDDISRRLLDARADLLKS